MSFADEVYQPFRFVSDAAGGMPMDQVNFVVCQLSAYPLGLLFRMIPTSQPTLRHLVGIVIGAAYCVLCFRIETLHLLIHALVTWVIVHYGGSKQHIIAMVVCMGHLMISNFHHRIYHWGEFALNVNGPLMILTQKMTQLAFAVKDGRAKDFDKMSPNFKKNFARLKCEPPTLIEILGHTFFFANVLCGPNHNYTDYKNFIEGRGSASTYVTTETQEVETIAAKLGCSVDELVKGNDLKGPKATVAAGTELKYVATPSGGIVHGIWCLLGAFFWAAWNKGLPGMLLAKASELVGVDATAYVTFLNELAPKKTKDQIVEGFFTYSMARLLVYQWLAMQFYRCTFYFAWLISEGANNVAGLGFKGNDAQGNADWTLLTNLNTRKVEFADNLKCVLDHWNIQTQRWLVFVCYERLPKSYNTYAVMLLSALWHGPYLGYYMTFITAAFVVEANRKVRNNIRPYFVPEGSKDSNTLYWILGWLTTLVVLNYLVGPFVELTADASIKYWNNQYWFLHIAVAFVLVTFPGKAKPKKDAAAVAGVDKKTS
eukprot:m.100341 g.100341  ORF g.100341 m.100341 type:complete len:542 (+) comp10343_c0_seq3:84-1709(+)